MLYTETQELRFFLMEGVHDKWIRKGGVREYVNMCCGAKINKRYEVGMSRKG